MVLQLVHSTVLAGMESFINHLLTLDSATRKKLEKLSGKILRVHCTRPPMTINLVICDDRIQLGSNEEATADTEIHGSGAALMKLLVTRETAGLHRDGIVINGDTGLLSALQEILLDLDVDWEYQLSKLIGDIPTQAVSDTVTAAENFSRHALDRFRQDIDEYIHEEKRMFPSSVELSLFYRGVDALRLRVDRLQSRTDRLSNPD